MSWIDRISYENSKGTLRKLYDKVKGPDDKVDNILMAHSLRPHTLTGHMTLYKNVLHHSNNTIPKWFLETIGVYVSYLNKCDYCVEHHLSGLKKLLKNSQLFKNIELNLRSDSFLEIFDNKYKESLEYSKQLTINPSAISKATIEKLAEVGVTHGEILEINQVTAYFNYANRTVLGLGVNIEGDILGLSPNNSTEEANWKHQ